MPDLLLKIYFPTKHSKTRNFRDENPLLRVPIAAGRYIPIHRTAARPAL